MHHSVKIKGHTRFTTEDVLNIKTMLREGRAPRDIAKLYKCGVETIRKMNRGETFPNVGGEAVELPKWTPEMAQASLEKALAVQAEVEAEKKLKTPDDPELAAKFAEAEVKARETADFFMGRNKKA